MLGYKFMLKAYAFFQLAKNQGTDTSLAVRIPSEMKLELK